MEKVIEVKVDMGEASVLEQELDKALTVGQGVIVKNAETYESAAGYLKTLKQTAKKWEDLRKSFTKPMDESKKRIMDFFRGPSQRMADEEKVTKNKMILYTDEIERKRKEEQAKLDRKAEVERLKKEEQQRAWEAKERAKRDEADRLEREGKEEEAQKARAAADKAADKAEERAEEAESVEAPIVAPEAQKPTGVSYRYKYTIAIETVDKIPREYMMPNLQALNAITQSTKGTIKIPGTRVNIEKILSSRS